MLHRSVREFESARPLEAATMAYSNMNIGLRLDPPVSLAKATAGVEQALADLRAIEDQLDRQLKDLRSYMLSAASASPTNNCPANNRPATAA